MELVTGVDVVALLATWLSTELDGRGWPEIPVRHAVPDSRPSAFVILRRSGGPLESHVIDRAQVTVDTWADVHEDAQDLAQLVRALLHALPTVGLDGHAVYRVEEFAGPALFDDPLSDQPRYRATYVVPVRADVVVD